MTGLRLVKVVLQLFKELGEDDVSGAASELAYKSFLALFPFLIFLTALGSFASDLLGVTNPTDEVMRLLGSSLPPAAWTLLHEQVDRVVSSKNGTLLSVGIVGAIWAASSGVGTVMKAMNRVYEVKETRSIARRYGLAVGLTLLAGGAVLMAFVLLFAGQVFGSEIADRLGLSGPGEILLTSVRYLAIVVLLLAAVAFLLWAAPNVDLPFKWISPGAVLFVLVWLPSTYLFGLYVSNFGSYDATYGTLGGVVALLAWLYLTSFVLLFGAELNSVLAQQGAPEELEARAGEAATSQTKHGGRNASDPQDQDSKPVRPQGPRLSWLFGAMLAALAIFNKAWGHRLKRA